MSEFRITTYNGWNEQGKGQHSVELVMALIGSEGAMVWRLALGITPGGPYPTQDHNLSGLYKVNFGSVCDMGLTAHSELTERTALDDDGVMSEHCEHLDGRACVCDYQTGLQGAVLFPAFACEGFDGVKRILTEKYVEHYGKEP